MSILDYLQKTLGARVTSAKRDPNSALGRANPRSYHNVGQAVDIAPIPGMNFQQYVQRLEDAGYDILEARDEVTNPSKHATGPHWHVAYGQGRAKGPIQLNPDQERFVKTAQVKPFQLSPEQQQRAASFNVDLDMPHSTPPIHDEPTGLAGILQPNFAAMSPDMVDGRDPLAPKKKTKFFGRGGVGTTIAGSIADALAQHWGAQPGYAPQVERRREREDEENKAMREYRMRVAQERQKRMEPRSLGGGNIGYIGPDGQPVITGQLPQQPTQTDRYVQEILDPNTPPERKALLQQVLTRPMVVDGQPLGFASGAPSGGPQPGAVEDGFVFMGGDPSNPANWRQQ